MGLDKLLYLRGVGAEFVDCSGQLTSISCQDRQAMLQAMLNVEVIDDALIAAQIDQLDVQPWRDMLPVFQHCYVDQLSLEFHLADNETRHITLEFESRQTLQNLKIDIDHSLLQQVGDYYTETQRFVRYRYPLPQRVGYLCRDNIGYLVCHLALAGEEMAQGELLIAPNSTYQLTANLAKPNVQRKPWGVSVHVPSLRSDTQWGVGDLADLQAIVNVVASQGGDFVILNPLHALSLASSNKLSPYSPIDRRFIHPLYISIEHTPEYKHHKAKLALRVLEPKRQQINASTQLDGEQVTSLKLAALYQLYLVFVSHELNTNSERALAFKAFVDQGESALAAYLEHQSTAVPHLLGDEHSDNDSRQFLAYLQFEASQQLIKTQQLATAQGMSIGLVGDLAVGTLADGTEVSEQPQQFCVNASIGAPADSFAVDGQNWGLTPLDPCTLKQTGFAHFRQLLRANMGYFGALRIDHIMSLFRLWWWVNESTEQPAPGAYIYYDVDNLFAILAYESHQAKCVVIGEDLGLVPEEVRQKLAQFDIYSNALFYFSYQQQHLAPPTAHPPRSLMMLANHDVAPFAAWWEEQDLQQKLSLGLLNESQFQQAKTQRAIDKSHLLGRWQELGLLANSDNYAAILRAWLTDNAQSSAALLSVQLCDLLAEKVCINIPGTDTQYPNWRQRYPKTITEIANCRQVHGLLQTIANGRGLSPMSAQMTINQSA
ncbi:4-alpha-glucanotransferase [Shewanella waksmanii]|uniref:4-alpha-glucanotransferase n=1 Tax=Shewanella waksmanii TaxID=213783 RepID=UPI003734CBDF